MERRALFSSDSDVSDDEKFPHRGRVGSGSARASNAAPDDPLSSRAAASDAAAAAAGSFMENQRPQPRRATDTDTTHDDLLPQSSKVTATRRNLSLLFGEGIPGAPKPAASCAAPSSAEAGVPRTSANAAAALSTFSPSSWPVSTSSSANIAEALFPPRFTYDGPSRSNSRSGGGDGGTHSCRDIPRTSEGCVAGLTTALHAVVQAYRDELYCGTCLLALCVPPSSNTDSATSPASSELRQLPPSAAARARHQRDSQLRQPTSSLSAPPRPILLLMSANRQALCTVPLDVPEAVFDGGSLQLHQNREQPQYITFFCASSGASGTWPRSSTSSDPAPSACWWTCMFPDRESALQFLVATYTVAQYAAALAKQASTLSAAVPTVRVLPRSSSSPSCAVDSKSQRPRRDPVHLANGSDGDGAGGGDSDATVVRVHVPTTIHWSTWALRRVSRNTPYCLPADCVDGTSPLSPRDVTPGSGALRGGLEAALLGMGSGESRLVFMTAEETRLRHPDAASPSFPRSAPSLSSNVRQRGQQGGESHEDTAEPRMLDVPAVAYVTCVNAVALGTAESTTALCLPAAPPQPRIVSNPQSELQTVSTEHTTTSTAATAATTAATTSALLQQLLLSTLQQQQRTAVAPPPPPLAQAAPPTASYTCDTLDRVMLQLSSLYEKIDRLDIEGKLKRNNVELEHAMKRVVGLAPQEEVAVEDTLKDRDALLASVERYRQKHEESNTNYQRALEAMGRSTEKAQALERDLLVQQDLWTRQRRDEAEQTRLRLLERDVRHREELERISDERYAAGRSDGHAAGYREGREAAITAVDGEGGVSAVTAEWKAKVTARDQQIVALQASLQDAKFHHERDRRQLRAEIDVLTDLNEKLQHMQANADVRMPEESTQQQCKRVKRTLNSVYSQVEAQLLTLPQRSQESITTTNNSAATETRCVSVHDVLAVVMAVIRAEAQSAVALIRADAERRATENAGVRTLTLARQHMQRPTVAYVGSATTDLVIKDEYSSSVVHRGGAAGEAASRHAAAAAEHPPMPPVHTTASRHALAAVAASLLPEVAHIASSSLLGDGAALAEPWGRGWNEAQTGASQITTVHAEVGDTRTSLGPAQAEKKPSMTVPSRPINDSVGTLGKSPVQHRLEGSAGDGAWWSPGVAVRESNCGETVTAPPTSAAAALAERSVSLTSPPRPSSSASLFEAASPPVAADPGRQATRLPDLRPSTPSTAAATEDNTGPTPPELAGRDDGGGVEHTADGAPSCSLSSTKRVAPLGEATASALVSTASTSSNLEGASPPLNNWQGCRLFNTPPSFTKPSEEE